MGSSRSGTTMMGRILNQKREIFTFKELHFFGYIWTNTKNKRLNKKEQIELLSRLFTIQKYGIFHQDNSNEFYKDSELLLLDKQLSSIEIYNLFLSTVTKKNFASISCEQTPKNIYYLDEIFSFFPQAKVINMVRDQRDVLLSQKNKWKRKFLGASQIPFFEAVRSYINYHPILTSKIWNSSLSHTLIHKNNKRVKIVKFEELLDSSEDKIKEICDFLGISFDEKMLEVPVVGSSTQKDESYKLFIDQSKISKWKNGMLSNAEIYLSQLFSSKMMELFNYKKKKFLFPPISILFYFISFPIKLFLAFLFNIHRSGSVIEVIKKRFFLR